MSEFTEAGDAIVHQEDPEPSGWLASTIDQIRMVTVKFLNFRMPKKFAVIYLKFKQEAKP